MAELDKRRYMQFNFLIDLGAGRRGPQAGFQECSGLGIDLKVAQHGSGGEKQRGIQKLTPLNKSTDVTLKRGVIAAADFNDWLDQVRRGDAGAFRTITITLQDELHQAAKIWKLSRARIIKQTSEPFNAKGNDVAIEELVIGYERLELK